MGSIVLIRHATTAASASGRNLGQRADPPLTLDGIELAHALGRALRAELAALAVDEVELVSSTALRCRQTLEAATGELAGPMPPARFETALLEIDYGAWDGLTNDECAARDAALRAAWERDPFATRCPDGESGAGVAARAFPVLASVTAWLGASRTRAALVVSHHHVIRLWLASLLGIGMADYRRVVTADPGGYSIVTHGDHGATIRRINATATSPSS